MQLNPYFRAKTGTVSPRSGKPINRAMSRSPALGQAGPGSSGLYLSQAIHGFHASQGAACLDCYPGATTKCNRSLAHMGNPQDGNCVICHGSMQQVAQSIETGVRTPWTNEPNCATCHTGVPGVDTGTALYRNEMGHGNIYCAACHESPHASTPAGRLRTIPSPCSTRAPARRSEVGGCATTILMARESRNSARPIGDRPARSSPGRTGTAGT